MDATRVVRGCLAGFAVLLLVPALFLVWWGGTIVSDWNVPVFDSSDGPGGPAGVVLIVVGVLLAGLAVVCLLVSRNPPKDDR